MNLRPGHSFACSVCGRLDVYPSLCCPDCGLRLSFSSVSYAPLCGRCNAHRATRTPCSGGPPTPSAREAGQR